MDQGTQNAGTDRFVSGDHPGNISNEAVQRLAVLFTDIKGSSDFYRRHGNMAGRIMTQRHNDLLFPVIETHHGTIVKTIGDSIMAYFGVPLDSLAAAIDMQRRLQAYNEQAGADDLLLVRMALNYGECLMEAQDIYGEAVNAAGRLIEHCDAEQIAVTEAFYREVGHEVDVVFTPCKFRRAHGLPDGQRAYQVRWADADAPAAGAVSAEAQKSRGDIRAFMPDLPVLTGVNVCYYCGVSVHPTHRCPSKLIREDTHSLGILGHVPFSRINKMFAENMEQFVTPLKSGKDEERFEALLGESRDGPYPTGFCSFYEITRAFQQRTIRQIFQKADGVPEGSTGKSGLVLMGLDCLRVTRLEEAAGWFEKALDKNPNDYRAYIGKALLAIERAVPERAYAYFRKALALTESDAEDFYVRLLCARLHEAAGDLSDALSEVQKALRLMPEDPPARYYQAQLLIKAQQTGPALNIIESLIEGVPEYFLAAALDPVLVSARDGITALLGNRLCLLRSQAAQGLDEIRESLDQYRQWFSREDEIYRQAQGLFNKATSILQEESPFGLMEVPALAARADALLRRAVVERRNRIYEKINRQQDALKQSACYLEKYPYKNLVTLSDIRAHEDFKQCLEVSRCRARTRSPQGLRETEMLVDKLPGLADRVSAGLGRLEAKKYACFLIEVGLKTAGFFLSSGTSTVLIFVSLLLSYQIYQGGLAGIREAELDKIFKNGLLAGLVSGVVLTGVWLRLNFSKMAARIGL